MAGTLFFDETHRVWSSSSNFFCDVIERAIKKCGGDEAILKAILTNAEEIRLLAIYEHNQPDIQAALTKRVLEAAQEKLKDLRADPTVHQEDVRVVAELAELAQAHLSSLRENAPD